MSDLQKTISDWLKNHLAAVFDIPHARIDGSTSFERYGLDSAAIVGMTGDLGTWLGCELDPTVAYDHPSVDALAHALAWDEAVQAAFRSRQPTELARGGE